MFSNCISLTSITIPSGVTKIGFRVFYNCSVLKDLFYLGETEPIFGDDVFLNCPQLKQVYVPINYQQDSFNELPVIKRMTSTFTKSSQLSNSIEFTKPTFLTLSSQFAPSSKFSKSNSFSNSIEFTKPTFLNLSFHISPSPTFSNTIASYTNSIYSDYMSQSHTQTLTVTYIETISMSETYEPTNIFITVYYSDSKYMISQREYFERKQIPIHLFTMSPTEYEFDIYIDTRPAADNQSKKKQIIIISVSIGILLIALCAIIVICYKKKSRNKGNEYSKADDDKIMKNSQNNQILDSLLLDPAEI